MYEANLPLLMLVLAGVFAVQLRWPVLPKFARLALGTFVLIFSAADWWWTIRLPIGRDLGFALNMISGLALIIVGILMLRNGSPSPEATPSP